MRLNPRMKNPIRNQKGIALVATLMLLVLGLGVVAILFRLVTQDTKLASLEQGYTTTLDAAKAGADLFIDMVQRGSSVPPLPNQPYTGPANPFGTVPNNGSCLNVKMNNPTSSWTAQAGWAASCGSTTSTQNPSAIDTNPADSPDITVTWNNGVAGAVPCTVNIKVINTYFSQPVNGQPNPGNCYYGCYYYTIVSRAQTTGSNEYSEVYFVYRYDK